MTRKLKQTEREKAERKALVDELHTSRAIIATFVMQLGKQAVLAVADIAKAKAGALRVGQLDGETIVLQWLAPGDKPLEGTTDVNAPPAEIETGAPPETPDAAEADATPALQPA